MISLNRFAGKGGKAMRGNCTASAAAIKAMPKTVFGIPVEAAMRVIAVVLLAVIIRILLAIVFPLAGSKNSFEDNLLAQEGWQWTTAVYTAVDETLVLDMCDLPAMSDIYNEYDLKVVHSFSARQVKSMQGGIWKIVWMASVFSVPYFYKKLFQMVRMYAYGISCFSCELLILLKKDGKKR